MKREEMNWMVDNFGSKNIVNAFNCCNEEGKTIYGIDFFNDVFCNMKPIDLAKMILDSQQTFNPDWGYFCKCTSFCGESYLESHDAQEVLQVIEELADEETVKLMIEFLKGEKQ